MFSILANIIIVFGLFGMLVATWMLFKGTKKAIEFAGVTHQKNKKIRPKKPNYFVRWWNHLKSLYEEDMRKQRMLKRSLPEVQVTEVNPTPTSGAESTEETIVTKTTEDTPVRETTETAAEEVVITTIDEADTEVDLTKVSKITGEMLKYGADADTVIKSTSEMLKTSPEFFSKKENSEEAVTEATEETVSEILEPEVLEPETKTKKRGKK